MGVLLGVTGGDEATLRATYDRASDVEEGAQPALSGDDELFGDLRPVSPPLEGRVQVLDVASADHVGLVRHGDVAPYGREAAGARSATRTCPPRLRRPRR